MVRFVLIIEEGVGVFHIHRFLDEAEARAKAAELWWCWVLYQRSEHGTVTELGEGGIGFAHPAIRQHAERLFVKEDRILDERAAAAEAKEWAERRSRFGCFIDETALLRRMPISRQAATAVVFGFKFLQFMDRGVQNGSPTEIAAFIERTTGAVSTQSVLFASIAATYTCGTVVGCIIAVGLLARGILPHALLKHGTNLWVLGVAFSAFSHQLPDAPFSFYTFVFARLVVGLGAGCVTVTWPPYIEAIAQPGERSMYMTLIETGTALGAALGFLYSAAMTAAHGWGTAYLLIAIAAVFALVLPACSLPPVAGIVSTGGYMPAFGRSTAGNVPDPSGVKYWRNQRPQQPSLESLMPSAADAKSVLLETCPNVARQFLTLSFCLFFCGVAGASGGLTALQTFFPQIAVLKRLWPDEVTAAASFGGAVVVGAMVGGPAHGFVAEWLSSRYGREREAPRLLLLIGVTAGLGVVASAVMDYALSARRALLADGLTALIGALLLGSLGLQVRIPLLLVPTANLQPLAVLCATLAGYLGELVGPLIAGSLKDGLAPHCAVVALGNSTHAVDPRCATSATDQFGLLVVVGSTQLVTLVGAACWAMAARVLYDDARASRPSKPPEPKPRPSQAQEAQPPRPGSELL